MKQSKKSTILIVEDNSSIALGIGAMLKYEGYSALFASSIKEAKKVIEKNEVALVIQDRMLPDGDGIDFIPIAKKIRPAVKVLILSVRNLSGERIQGLRVGGDDYLAKPFEGEELLLRINNLLTLSSAAASQQPNNAAILGAYQFGKNTIDFERMIAINYKDQKRPLTMKDVKILQYFIANPNKFISREKLFEQVWQSPYDNKTRTIDNFILRFRKFFEEDIKNPRYFIARRNVGYMLNI